MIKLLKLSVTESSLAQRDELYEINYLVVHYNKLLHCYTQTHTHTHTYIYIYIYIYIQYIYIYIYCNSPYYTNTLNLPNVSAYEHVLYSQNCTFWRHIHTNTGLLRDLSKRYHNRHFSKSRNTGINIVLYLVLIVDGNGISFHYRLSLNITICHVTSLAPTQACERLSTRTQFGLTSGSRTLLTHKADVFSILCYGRMLQGRVSRFRWTSLALVTKVMESVANRETISAVWNA